MSDGNQPAPRKPFRYGALATLCSSRQRLGAVWEIVVLVGPSSTPASSGDDARALPRYGFRKDGNVNTATITNNQTTVPSLAVSLAAPADTLTRPRNGPIAAQQHAFRRMTGLLEDAGLLMVVVFLVPVAILLVGAPLALGIRAIIAIAHLLSWR